MTAFSIAFVNVLISLLYMIPGFILYKSKKAAANPHLHLRAVLNRRKHSFLKKFGVHLLLKGAAYAHGSGITFSYRGKKYLGHVINFVPISVFHILRLKHVKRAVSWLPSPLRRASADIHASLSLQCL